MNGLIGNLVYGVCATIALVFIVGAAVVLLAWVGESPPMASGFAIALSLLTYGFGWSSRLMLTGRGWI